MKADAQFIVAAVLFMLCVALGSVADKVEEQVIAWVAASTDTGASGDVNPD